jgi:hypothetical protein
VSTPNILGTKSGKGLLSYYKIETNRRVLIDEVLLLVSEYGYTAEGIWNMGY